MSALAIAQTVPRAQIFHAICQRINSTQRIKSTENITLVGTIIGIKGVHAFESVSTVVAFVPRRIIPIWNKIIIVTYMNTQSAFLKCKNATLSYELFIFGGETCTDRFCIAVFHLFSTALRNI